jgi:hypothetical protein
MGNSFQLSIPVIVAEPEKADAAKSGKFKISCKRDLVPSCGIREMNLLYF